MTGPKSRFWRGDALATDNARETSPIALAKNFMTTRKDIGKCVLRLGTIWDWEDLEVSMRAKEVLSDNKKLPEPRTVHI